MNKFILYGYNNILFNLYYYIKLKKFLKLSYVNYDIDQLQKKVMKDFHIYIRS